ncbi:uncharacterized protein LOC143416666 [Maylandia zebra]|uniref:uncharacterized protein LOC143416666 n=1 Tax=Maylandia zebra TaxID=106582 RepID=UPI00403C7D98
MGATLLCELGLFFAVLTIEPSSSSYFIGEFVTFKCDMNEGRHTDWYYEIKKDGRDYVPYRENKDYTLEINSTDQSVPSKPTVTLQPSWPQIYSGETVTVRFPSKPTVTLQPSWPQIYSGETVTVRYEPRPVLTVSPSWLSPGASVTLNCEVEHPSAGWSFYWYKAVPDLAEKSSSYELLPDGNVHSSASLTVSPDRVQHFTSDSVSLTCEGNFTEWRVRKFSEDGRLSDCRRMTGSTCDINTSKSDTGVYWCESGSGEFSSAVNITVQNDGNGPILVSPVHPVTEGASVSLSCSLRTQKILSNVFFYHNDKLIQNDPRGELKISAVSKSDEGFYKCQYSGRESAQSWMSVKGEQDQNM